MLHTRLYYRLKPVLPWTVRMAVRRFFAKRKRRRCTDIWPILESAARKPDGWPGWPDAKQFALVLTHDVEGPRGLARVKPLAELEMSLGFRSSFNFIPEGSYTVPRDLRHWLTDHGFEVGVHDLHHDGRLYQSRQAFRRHAQKINQYLADWGAVGFRSGFMLRELDWLHDLNIQYDASTFDTDPFEPQPDGVGTIFPFWVARPAAGDQRSEVRGRRAEVSDQRAEGRGQRAEAEEQSSRGRPMPTSDLRPPPSALRPPTQGYLELPYTLPQDITLFPLFREPGIDIWTRKLDWIAQHGGMALLNVHPDYVAFEKPNGRGNEFPAALYRRFLAETASRYRDALWCGLPNEVARMTAARLPTYHWDRKRICMVTHSIYESDNRVMRYAEALAERGDTVEVVALKRHPAAPRREKLNGVEVHRLQARSRKDQQTRRSYLFPLLRFFLRSTLWLAWRHLRSPYHLVHVHNVPDFLVFAAWFPRLTGARLILDIHDIVPEFYASKFQLPADHHTVRNLKRVEKAAARFAHHIILSNHLWLDTFVQRSAPADKCSVFINHVDHRLFRPHPCSAAPDRNGSAVVLFPGGLQWHQGLDLAIRAFPTVLDRVPTAELHIYGDGPMKDDLVALTQKLDLDGKVRFFDPLPIREIAEVMAGATLGIVPKRADSFGNEAYSTKIMEFMAVGVPVVVSRTRIDQYYFSEPAVRFFASGDVTALGTAISDVLCDENLRQDMATAATAYVAEQNWDNRKNEYTALVDRLCRTAAAR